MSPIRRISIEPDGTSRGSSKRPILARGSDGATNTGGPSGMDFAIAMRSGGRRGGRGVMATSFGFAAGFASAARCDGRITGVAASSADQRMPAFSALSGVAVTSARGANGSGGDTAICENATRDRDFGGNTLSTGALITACPRSAIATIVAPPIAKMRTSRRAEEMRSIAMRHPQNRTRENRSNWTKA